MDMKAAVEIVWGPLKGTVKVKVKRFLSVWIHPNHQSSGADANQKREGRWLNLMQAGIRSTLSDSPTPLPAFQARVTNSTRLTAVHRTLINSCLMRHARWLKSAYALTLAFVSDCSWSCARLLFMPLLLCKASLCHGEAAVVLRDCSPVQLLKEDRWQLLVSWPHRPTHFLFY